MPLGLIHGPTGSGKTTYAISAFIKALDDGKTPLFIAPSEPDARHFERQILASRDPVFGGKITTFGGLCREILSAAEPGLSVLDPGGRLTLIRAVIDAAGGLRVLDDSSGFDGFISALADLFSEFGLLGIEPGEMQRTLTPWSKGNKWRQELTKDLFYLYQEYRTALVQMDSCDEETAQRRVLAFFKGPESLATFPYTPVIIDGFWDFTPLQHEFIQALADAGDLLVTLPYQKGKAAYAATRPHFELLIRRAAGRSKQLTAQNSEDRSPALRHVVNHLFEEDDERLPADLAGEDVIILRAAGLRGQAELVAAEILKLGRDGQSLDDVAVVCRSIDRDLIALASALEEFSVPYEMPAPVPLSRTPVGAAALAALEFAAGGQSRSALLSYLRSGLSGEAPEEIDRFDRHIRLQGIHDRNELLAVWKKRTRHPLDGLGSLISAAAVGTEALAAELCNLIGRLVSAKVSESEISADHLGLDLLAYKSLKSVCRESVRAVRILAEDRDGSGRPEKGASASSEGGHGSEAVRLLKRGIEAATVRLPTGQRRQCVRLLDPHRVLNQRFDMLFICGLLEKQFPSLGREDAFFSDRDRRDLARNFGLALDAHDRRLDEERFLFHRTISRAKKKLYLCYPYCDKEGRPTVRSLFLEDVLDLFEEGIYSLSPDGRREGRGDRFDNSSRLVRQRKIGDVAFPIPETPTAGQALRSLALASSVSGRESAMAAARPAGLQDRLRACLDAAHPVAPRLTDIKILDKLREQNEFVVTELQRYLGCPFRYFVESLLQPLDMDPPAHGLRRGQAVHGILCRFGERLRSLGLVIPEADNDQLAEARRLMDSFVDEEFSKAGSDLETVILKTDLVYHLNRFIDRELQSRRRFRVYDVEVSFGGRQARSCGGKESTDDMLNFGGVRLRGRIDRIDWAGDRDLAIVIDYKSSRTVTSQRHFEQNKEIQIPLYMMALKIFGLNPIAGEYYAVRGEKRAGLYLDRHADLLGAASDQINRSDFVDEEVFEQRMEAARRLVMEAVQGIRSGSFPCEPLPDACRYCELDGICRRPEARLSPAIGDGGGDGGD